MKHKGSIKKRLIGIIFLVATITSLFGYGSFIYWYMSNQYIKTIESAQTVGLVLSQDVAKLVLFDEISVASDITSKLKSFKSLDTMVLYGLDKKPIFQYSKKNLTFQVSKFTENPTKSFIVTENILNLDIDARYEGNHLGYIQLTFEVDTIFDAILKNIKMPILIWLGMILISYLLAIFFAKRFTQPILELVQFLEKIEALDYLDNYPVSNENNEYGKLYQEISTMLKRIQTSQEALKIAAVAFETQSGMLITDANKKILQVNKAFTNILGYTQEDVIGNTPAIFKSGFNSKEFYDNLNLSLVNNHYWSGEITNRHKNGNIIKEYLAIQVVLDEEGEIIYYVASFLDLTLQKETEQKLKENEQMLVQQSKMAAMGEMLENIAHQWRQPLSVISTISSGMLLNKELGIVLTDDEEVIRLNKISNSTHYLSQTIDDFRDFFKPDKQKNLLDLKDSYEKTLKLVNSTFKHLSVEVVENLEIVEILSLKNELMQTMMNILNNAKDALEMTEKTHKRYIFVDIFKENNQAIIKIKDNAGGVPNEIIGKIFEPYFTTKEKTNGTGIGLHMSYEMIVKHLNGILEVENETYIYDNISYTGACFTIKLPLD